MTIVKPDYYNKFCCIADKCDFTCCGNWEIGVDTDTYEKWKKLNIDEMESLINYTLQKDDAYIINLNEHRSCPFLTDKGLCKIVLTHGEENISDTCHTFPREKREYFNRTEYGLALGCKSVIDILWQQEDFSVWVSKENDDENKDNLKETDEQEIYFELRDYFMEILSDKNRCKNPAEALKVIFIILLDIIDRIDKTDIDIYNDDNTFTDEFRVYENEIITQVIRETDLSKLFAFVSEESSSKIDRFIEDNELLLDIMENYRIKGIYKEYIEPVARCAMEYENTQYQNIDEMKLIEFDDFFQQYNDKLRLIVKEEIYDSLLPAMDDIYCIAMKIEWLAVEYTVISQWMRLNLLNNLNVSESELRQCIAVVFRMTGYSDEDIVEYMEDSFEDSVWDYGYFDLIV